MSKSERNKQLFSLGVKALLGYGIVYGAIAFVLSYFEITVPAVQEYFAQFGGLAAVMFFVAVVMVAITPLPDAPVVSAGILILDIPLGFVVIWLGMTTAAIINFFIARKIGKSAIEKRFPQVAEYMNIFAKKSGFESIVAGRAFSFFTFDIVSFAAGLTKIDFNTYLFASVLGIIPVAINYTILGAGIASQTLSGVVYASVVSLLIASLLAYGSRLYRKRRSS